MASSEGIQERHMMQKQRGITFIGWVFLLIPLVVVAYALMRVTPLYLNYYKVVEAMKTTANEYKNEETLNPTAIRNSISKRFDVGYVDDPKASDIKVSRNGMGQWEMQCEYEAITPLFANVMLVIAFEKTVPFE
jgi:hypothetical protein